MERDNSTKMSFIELVDKYNIVIPILQRDYAQGRTEELGKLSDFLYIIRGYLSSSQKLNLDFIYGYDQMGSDNQLEFIPIDGQQRLTTIFLLHWYLSKRESQFDNFRVLIQDNTETKFTYQTRIASQEFCKTLIFSDFDISGLTSKSRLSDLIKQSPLFYKSWLSDPTVNAFLNALDQMHFIFNDSDGFYSKLVNDKLIQFEFLDPKKIELSDEFYIKMNSRGLPLTKFENFKGELIKKMKLRFEAAIIDPFVLNFDNKWSDFIWDASIEIKTDYDKAYMNFITYFFQMLHYEKIGLNKSDYTVYKVGQSIEDLLTEENIKFLSNSFQIISNYFVQAGVSNPEFDILFTKRRGKEKLTLFGNEYYFVNQCLKNQAFGHFEKLMLFAVLKYYYHHNPETDNKSHLKDFLRIIRNVLINTNQSKKEIFTTDLREDRYPGLLTFISRLSLYNEPYEGLKDIHSDNNVIIHEKDKANLISLIPGIKLQLFWMEDHEYLKGCLNNFMFLFTNMNFEREKVIEIFDYIFDPEVNRDFLLISSLMCTGEYTVRVAGSGLGEVFYLGKHKFWHRVLANTNRESNEYQKETFENLFTRLYLLGVSNDLLEKYITKYQTFISDIDWKYYFKTYESIIKSDIRLIIYNDNGGFERFELLDGQTMASEHIDYLIYAVVNELSKININLDLSSCFKTSSQWSSLIVNDDLVMKPDDDKWILETKIDYSKLEPKIIKDTNEGVYYLPCLTNIDMVITAVDFIKKLNN